MRMLRIMLSLALVGTVLTVSAQPDRNSAVGSVLDYIVLNRSEVGIACFPIGNPGAGVYLNADERFPLASVGKILVLAEYARRIAEGQLDPMERVPLADVDAYWLPRTDGNRHQAWLEETPTRDGTVPLFEIARSMMYYSSNAATDYLAERFGRASFVDLYARLNIRDIDYPTNWIGLFLTLENHQDGVRSVEDFDAESFQAESDRLTRLYVDHAAWRLAERANRAGQGRGFIANGEEQNAYFERYGAQGTPRAVARLMSAIFSGELISERVSAIMRDIMDWEMDNPTNRVDFNMLATKGGSLPGILTGAWFAAPRGSLEDIQPRQPTALAVFYRGMPIAQYRSWQRDPDQRLLEIDALRNGCGVLSRAVGQPSR